MAEAEHDYKVGAGTPRVIKSPITRNYLTRCKTRDDSGKYNVGIRGALLHRQNADADHCQWIAKIDPY
jgi:hypothetical protein